MWHVGTVWTLPPFLEGQEGRVESAELSAYSRIKLTETKIPSFIRVWLWKKLPGLFLGRSEFLVCKKQQTIFKSLGLMCHVPVGWQCRVPRWLQMLMERKLRLSRLPGLVWRHFFQIPGTIIFPGFLEMLSAKISAVDGKTEGEHTNNRSNGVKA